MEPGKKRKLDDGPGQEKGVCIIHVKAVKSDDFTFIKHTKDPAERFKRILAVNEQRLSQPFESPYRMDDICAQIPEAYEDNHGYHRTCYTRFTANLSRLKDVTEEQPPTSQIRVARRSTDKDNIVFNPDCIFCNKTGKKKVKVKGVWTTEDTTVFERGGGDTVLQCAEKKDDFKLLRRISGFDLFSCEAKFHPSCRRIYVSSSEKWKSEDEENVEQQAGMEKAHRDSYEKVCQVVNNEVLIGKRVVRVSDLHLIYVSHLNETQFANPNYRGEKLKSKLERDYHGRISFCPIGSESRFSSYLVFNMNMDLTEAIKSSYQLRQQDQLKEVADIIRDEVIQKYQDSGEMSWPLTVTDLSHTSSVLPQVLKKFLTHVLCGDKSPSFRLSGVMKSIHWVRTYVVL